MNDERRSDWSGRTASEEKPIVAYFDDSKTNLDMVGLYLRKYGFQPVLVHVQGEDREDLKALVDEALAQKPVAVITDFDMKTCDGRDTLAAVRAYDSTVPVFLYTGEDFGTYKDRDTITVGFTEIFGKTEFRQLTARINELFGKPTQVSP